MAKDNNLTDFLTDVADAIRAKKGTTEPINPQDFSAEIASIEGGGGTSMWTGHADVEGLRAIGWTDEDIAYYQRNGVNWDEEDDQYHLVSDDNKALYGVLTTNNISSYVDRIVYLPKIDTSGLTSMARLFSNCDCMVAIPMLDTSNVTDMSRAFNACSALAYIPLLDTSKVTTMAYMCYLCPALAKLPKLDISEATNVDSIFYGCSSLRGIAFQNANKIKTAQNMCYNCRGVTSIRGLDLLNATSINNIVTSCKSLTHIYIDNLTTALLLNNVNLLSKESLLYIIENEAATTAITIQLAAYAYTRLANDPDIVAALTQHPNISLAK